MVPLTAGNTRVKEAGKLHRRSVRSERRCFLADGPKAVQGALAVPGCVVELFATPAAAERYADVLGEMPCTLVDERAMGALSDSVNPAGVVAVCHFLADVAQNNQRSSASAPLVTICADIRDPGNAGTVIRTSDAVGAERVVLAGESVDMYKPKTIRASVGSQFHLTISVEP
ncbi:MAG: RNA methyltransferase, partial [Nocardioidaceae bacterium]|nr:RNA methyltransferase [Nocardioidaceae bacterium]